MSDSITVARLRVVMALSRAVRNTLAPLLAYEGRQRQRVALAQLSDHLLDDIGVSREAARAEARKPCWR
jgi:uncharacterized protein YjiS (DUF1127 family)